MFSFQEIAFLSNFPISTPNNCGCIWYLSIITNWSEYVYQFQLSFVLSRWRIDIEDWYCNNGFIVLLYRICIHLHILKTNCQFVLKLYIHMGPYRCMFWIVCGFILTTLLGYQLFNTLDSFWWTISQLVALIANIDALYV